MAPPAAAWLDAWESGATEGPLNRAPSLLRSLDIVPPDQSIDDLTIGECDTRLLELYRSAFGDWIEAVASCPACGDEVELRVPVCELLPVYERASEDPASIELDG